MTGKFRINSDDSAGGASLAVEQIIARALIDCEFRDLLFADRKAALVGYDLSEPDLRSLDLLDQKALSETQEVALIVGATCGVDSDLSPSENDKLQPPVPVPSEP